jgi:hypothetical protein
MGNFDKAKQLYTDHRAFNVSRGLEIPEGAIKDLRDLISEKILVKESAYIIENIFRKKVK